MTNLPTLSVRYERREASGRVIFGLFCDGRFYTRDFNGAAFDLRCRGVDGEEAIELLNDLIGHDSEAFDVTGSGDIEWLGDCLDDDPFDERDWRDCRCGGCADERSLQRAKSVDPERWASL